MTLRNEVLSFIQHWHQRSQLPVDKLLSWLGIKRGRYQEWVKCKDTPNTHSAQVPKENWILPEERLVVIDYAKTHIGAGYRRMTYLMLDENVAAISPSSTYRILKEAGLLESWAKRSSKGTGFEHPIVPH